jgi:hypothetical protein
MREYLLRSVENVEGGEDTLYKLIPIEGEGTIGEAPSIQSPASENASDKSKVKVLIEGKERIPLKVLLRKSDDFGRFSLGKGDKSVIRKSLLVIVLEPVDPDDRIFMEPIK